MEPFTLVIFGITSNLVQIKLIPALYDLAEKGLLPKDLKIIGIARRDLSEEQFKSHIHEALHSENKHHQHEVHGEIAHDLLHHFHYLQGNFDDTKDTSVYEKLKSTLKDHDSKNLLFYLATYPELYEGIFNSLNKYALNKNANGWTRLIIEKPFGSNEKTARELDKLLHNYFSEDQIFRLDHYLGKETLQNILTFRFSNEIFEHIVDSEHLDHIQITASEDIGIEKRGAYYDVVGALKDVGQNHELQLLTAVTMEAPTEFSNPAVTKERIKVLKKLVANPKDLVLGQYNGYLYEQHVAPKSETDTFFALKTEVATKRFKGIPIYIRAGKRLASYTTEINLIFKAPHSRLFSHLELGNRPNVLTYRIFPDEGIGLQVLTKSPTHDWRLDTDHMTYHYPAGANDIPDAYEKLLYDAIKGDQTFFNDAEEVEAQWAFTDKLLANKPKVVSYEPGSWGPKEAFDLIERDGRKWLEPKENF